MLSKSIFIKITVFLLFFILPIFVFAWSPVPPRELEPLVVWLVVTALIAGGLIMAGALIIAGIQYLTSAGDPKKMAQAKEGVIKSAIGIGLLAIFSTILFILNPELLDPLRLIKVKPPPSFFLSLERIQEDQEEKQFKTIYFDPHVPLPVTVPIYWKIEEQGDRVGKAVRCEGLIKEIPENATVIGWEGEEIPYTVEELHSRRVGVGIQAGIYTLGLRCYNERGFHVTETVKVELRPYEIFYRVPTGKIIEWAVFDYNARMRFEKTQYFIQSATQESNRLIESLGPLISYINNNSRCGTTYQCRIEGNRCVPVDPGGGTLTADRRVCGVAEVGDLDEETFTGLPCVNIICANPAEKLNKIVGPMYKDEVGIEGILLAPQDPGNEFVPFKYRRPMFFGLRYPIDLDPRLSVVYPPPPNDDDHSGAFNHWRTADNRKWVNFLKEKRKIEAARREIEVFRNSLQLASYLMSVGCKYHADQFITHNQILPTIARDPFYDGNERVEVIDIIKQERGITVRDLINWKLEDTDIYKFTEEQGECEEKKVEGEQRMAVVEAIKELTYNRRERPFPPRPLVIPSPFEWPTITCPHAVTIFEYDPFTFYCNEYYEISRILMLKQDRYRITDIKFRGNPSSPEGSRAISSIKDNKQQTAMLASAPLIGEPLIGEPLYVADLKIHEIPSGQAVEEAMYLLANIEKYLYRIIEAMRQQERAALRIIEMAFECHPNWCNPECQEIRDEDGNLIGCHALACDGRPYDIDGMNTQLGIIKGLHNRAFNLENLDSYASRINDLIHAREGEIVFCEDKDRRIRKEFDPTIWLFPQEPQQEMTRIEKIEALTHQTRAMMAVCPIRPRGLLYYVYGGEIIADPVSFIEIRERILEGESIEGIYSIQAAAYEGEPAIDCREGINDGKPCLPPYREHLDCLECLRKATRQCQNLCIANPKSEHCLECLPGRSLLNYFCLVLEEVYVPE